MIAPVDRFLLDREDHRAEVLVVGEVVPVLGPVEVLLVRFLLDRGQLETLLLFPLLLDRCLFSAEMLTGKWRGAYRKPMMVGVMVTCVNVSDFYV